MTATLVLADGRTFRGEAFGAEGEALGEVVFNTSMSGYQEILTDPSYCGQLVAMTYPLIGNYGVNPEDYESERPHLRGFIIKELSGVHSNWRATGNLSDFLKENNVIGIQGIDTRALTRHIREKGAQQAILSTVSDNVSELHNKVKDAPGLAGLDLVKEVTCSASYDWEEGEWEIANGKTALKNPPDVSSDKGLFFVVAYDFGVKRNILRKLRQAGCKVRVVPADTSAEDVLAMKPDGVFLSNGPGDPEGVPYAMESVKKLIGKVPLFAICLGHQILSLALGGKTYKLRFGHHGGNQPVMNLATRKVEITSQNHGFAVEAESMPEELKVASMNLNDQTVEGIRREDLSILSVQYHPEASPGPCDSDYLFEEFVQMMKAR